jgi:hypothetical protein
MTATLKDKSLREERPDTLRNYQAAFPQMPRLSVALVRTFTEATPVAAASGSETRS